MPQPGGASGTLHPRQDSKIFCGGLSWGTTAEKLEAYFSNFGQVLEAFVNYDRHTGRPRGFGFVVFDDPQVRTTPLRMARFDRVAEKVASLSHTIDRREVEAKKAVPKEEHPGRAGGATGLPPGRTRKVFVGGLAPSVDEAALRQYFEQFGPVDDAVVMLDHENRRPRGFGFVTFANEDTVDDVLNAGPLQALHDKQIEIKRAVPRDQMPPPRGLPLTGRGAAAPPYLPYGRGAPYAGYPPYPQPVQAPYGLQAQGFGQTAYGGAGYRGGGGIGAVGLGGMPAAMGSAQLGMGAGLSGLNTAGFSAQYGGSAAMHNDPNQLVGAIGGNFGQTQYGSNLGGMGGGLGSGAGLGGGGGGGFVGGLGAGGLGGDPGGLAGGGGSGLVGDGSGLSGGSLGADASSLAGSAAVTPHAGLDDGALAARSLGSGSFNMGNLQSALPAVQTNGSGSDSFAGATGGGSTFATPRHATPHGAMPQSPSAVATSAGFIASSPSAFDSALGSPMGGSLAAAQQHLTPHGSLGRDTASMGGLQSSFTDTPLGSANWG